MRVHTKKKEPEPAACKKDEASLETENQEKIALGEALNSLFEQWGGEEATLPKELKEALDVYRKRGVHCTE